LPVYLKAVQRKKNQPFNNNLFGKQLLLTAQHNEITGEEICTNNQVRVVKKKAEKNNTIANC